MDGMRRDASCTASEVLCPPDVPNQARSQASGAGGRAFPCFSGDFAKRKLGEIYAAVSDFVKTILPLILNSGCLNPELAFISRSFRKK